jgi:hypothetical protein
VAGELLPPESFLSTSCLTLAYAPHAMSRSHSIKLFDVWTERVDGKSVLRTAPLGTIAMDFERNMERRKNTARERSRAHVGREPSSVSHGIDSSIVASFRRP